MIDDLEVVVAGLGVLQFLDVVVLEFDDLAAAHTDEVVVMFAPLRPFVELFPVSEILLFQDLALFQKRQGPVNRRLGNRAVGFFGERQQFLRGKMAVGVNGLMKDGPPLAGKFKVFFLEKIRERLFGFFDHTTKLPTKPPIVNSLRQPQ